MGPLSSSRLEAMEHLRRQDAEEWGPGVVTWDIRVPDFLSVDIFSVAFD